jgi:deazaflavin-dependent oxidoreductase (nitroreductase family)
MANWDWVEEHIRRYRETGGEDGHIWQGRDGTQSLPCLLLTTKGRKTGAPRTTALIYGRDGDNHVVVASRAGSDEDPLWYRNLAADPAVELQVKADVFPARARTATGAERQRLWAKMVEVFPKYEEYRAMTEGKRQIPVVVLERA